MAVTKLSQIVKLNGSFRNSINLYLNLNKKEKIDSYIPTKSSLNILKRYVGSVIKNKDHSTILIGSYGKGKSHLLLILLAIVSMQRTKENNEIVKSLLKKIRMVDEETFEIVSSVWNKKGRFLPVIISGSCVLSFTGKNGEVIQKYYDPVDSDEGTMFRNIIEDQLESFSDLDVNVRVAILLEMIEKVMRKEE